MRHTKCAWLLLFCVMAEIVSIIIYYRRHPPITVITFRNNDAAAFFAACESKSHPLPDDDEATTSRVRRNFKQDPVRIGGSDYQRAVRIADCPVTCIHYPKEKDLNEMEKGLYFDASFVNNLHQVKGSFMGFSILRTMESAAYRPDTRLEDVKGRFDIVMTPRLDSDVPVPYFSWELHDFMQSPSEKTSKRASSIVFSNCDARSIRSEAVAILANLSLVDVFGMCSPKEAKRFHGDKLDLIGKYKFHLAFENSNDVDYVTEKFFHSLVVGSVPVVIGAPNIHHFAPGENSLLVIEKLSDVFKIAKRMTELFDNETEYQDMLSWKKTGPSNEFKALVDLSIVHSSCRLCIHVADKIRQKEEHKREDCSCKINETARIHRFYVRERGRFDYLEAYLSSPTELTLARLASSIFDTFTYSTAVGYWPLWSFERDENGRRPDPSRHRKQAPPLRLYRIYETGHTQSDVLFGKAALSSDTDVRELFSSSSSKSRCVHLEVIFV